jgi:hypothetical protein
MRWIRRYEMGSGGQQIGWLVGRRSLIVPSPHAPAPARDSTQSASNTRGEARSLDARASSSPPPSMQRRALATRALPDPPILFRTISFVASAGRAGGQIRKSREAAGQAGTQQGRTQRSSLAASLLRSNRGVHVLGREGANTARGGRRRRLQTFALEARAMYAHGSGSIIAAPLPWIDATRGTRQLAARHADAMPSTTRSALAPMPARTVSALPEYRMIPTRRRCREW